MLSEVFPQERHWHRGVHGRPGLWASKDISSPVKARSKPDVSPPIVRYARASDSNVLSLLAFLGQMSSPAKCPHAPHAWQLIRLFSSARRFLRSSNDRLLPLYLPLPLPLIFPLPLLLPLPLAVESLPRDHSYCVQLQSLCQRVVRLWVFGPSYPAKRRDPSHGCRRLPSHPAHHHSRQECLPPRKRLCQSIP